MARWGGSTTQRGYGYWHRKERARQIALWHPGQPCARCGQPIWELRAWRNGRWQSVVDLGHTTDRLGYRGLEHMTCNRGDTERRGYPWRRTATPAGGSARRW